MRCAYTLLLLLALLLLLGCATPIWAGEPQAQRVETVVVEDGTIAGIWKFPSVERVWAWSTFGTDFMDMGPEQFCRCGPDGREFTFDCFGPTKPGRASLQYGHVRISWKAWNAAYGYSGTDYSLFQGILKDNRTIFGHMAAVYEGRIRENPRPLTLTKMTLNADAPDRGGQSAFLKRLLGEVIDGTALEPYDPQSTKVSFPTADDLRPLGKILFAIYVGVHAPTMRLSGAHIQYSDTLSDIYAVEFENGERLCGLHRRIDGALDAFRCL